MLPLVLVKTPAAVPVTSTEKVQETPGARLAPLSSMVLEPGTAVMVPPPHPPVSPFGVATTRPTGRMSVKLKPVNVVELPVGLVTVKVSALEPPWQIDSYWKVLVSVGRRGRGQPVMVTLSSSIEEVALLPLVTAVIRNQVVETPEDGASTVMRGCQLPFVTFVPPGFASVKFVPSVLVYT